jgi:hypothetical protein
MHHVGLGWFRFPKLSNQQHLTSKRRTSCQYETNPNPNIPRPRKSQHGKYPSDKIFRNQGRIFCAKEELSTSFGTTKAEEGEMT